MEDNCPLCKSNLEDYAQRPKGYDGNYYLCPNCGSYYVTRTAVSMLEKTPYWERAELGHRVWKGRISGPIPELNSRNVNEVRREDLPGPDEQLDNLITYWGEEQGLHAGERLKKTASELRAKIGAVTEDDALFILREAVSQGFIDGKFASRGLMIGQLTFRGWKEYRRIERGQSVSHHAFMAMPFGYKPITRVVDEVFRPAVKETGFTLKRLDDEPRSGLIDDRLRVEIRQCKFLIADLTEMNRGAYWEAGFAEGLGKHVIYTCEKSFFVNKDKEPGKGTHFDTNHHTTILWESDKPKEAAEQLKATIRNTFPFEAKMPPEPG